MLELLIGFTITLISLLVGFSLGRYQQSLPPSVNKQIQQIFKKVVPDTDVGGIEPPTQRDLDFYNNPKLAREHEELNRTFDKLNENKT